MEKQKSLQLSKAALHYLESQEPANRLLLTEWMIRLYHDSTFVPEAHALMPRLYHDLFYEWCALLKFKKSREVDYSREISEVIDYLNMALGYSGSGGFRKQSKITQRYISKLLSDRFTVDQIKQVIDCQVAKWINDAKMREFLRPQTLFGEKFESYLHAPTNGKPNEQQRSAFAAIHNTVNSYNAKQRERAGGN